MGCQKSKLKDNNENQYENPFYSDQKCNEQSYKQIENYNEKTTATSLNCEKCYKDCIQVNQEGEENIVECQYCTPSREESNKLRISRSRLSYMRFKEFQREHGQKNSGKNYKCKDILDSISNSAEIQQLDREIKYKEGKIKEINGQILTNNLDIYNFIDEQ